MMTNTQYKVTLLTRLRRLVEEWGLTSLWAAFEESENFMILGGAPRDLLYSIIHGTEVSIEDLDIVVDGNTRLLTDLVKALSIHRNRFSGLKIVISESPFRKLDVWSAKDTWVIKSLGWAPTFESVVRGVVFNLEEIGIVSREKLFLGNELEKDLRDKVLRMKPHPHPFPILQAVRAVVISRRLGLTLSDETADFIKSVFVTNPIDAIVAEAASHYSKRNHLQAITNIALRIRHGGSPSEVISYPS
jgi:hypothetical protein